MLPIVGIIHPVPNDSFCYRVTCIQQHDLFGAIFLPTLVTGQLVLPPARVLSALCRGREVAGS
jgi:hypothetical protein